LSKAKPTENSGPQGGIAQKTQVGMSGASVAFVYRVRFQKNEENNIKGGQILARGRWLVFRNNKIALLSTLTRGGRKRTPSKQKEGIAERNHEEARPDIDLGEGEGVVRSSRKTGENE